MFHDSEPNCRECTRRGCKCRPSVGKRMSTMSTVVNRPSRAARGRQRAVYCGLPGGRMDAITGFLKKHTLWVGFLAVLAPLLVMLGLQFVWLARLKQVSALAEKAAHNNYLEAIGTEVQYSYRSAAERALNIPGSLFRQKRLDEVAAFWKKKPVEGVRRLFLVDFTHDRFGNYYLFDPRGEHLDPYPASDE